MSKIVVFLSALGLVGGLAFIAGPWVFGVPGPSLGFVIAPALLGATVALTHWRNLKRARSAVGHTSFVGAVCANVALLALFLIGGTWLYQHDSALPRFPVAALLYTSILILPLVANAIYVVAARKRK